MDENNQKGSSQKDFSWLPAQFWLNPRNVYLLNLCGDARIDLHDIYAKEKKYIVHIEFQYLDRYENYTVNKLGELKSFERLMQDSTKKPNSLQYNICCWYNKEKVIYELLETKAINNLTAGFMRTRHQCRLNNCHCCEKCRVVDEIKTEPDTKNLQIPRLENMISIKYTNQSLTGFQKMPTNDTILSKTEKYKKETIAKRLASYNKENEVNKRSLKNAIIVVRKRISPDSKDVEIYDIGETMDEVACFLFFDYKNRNLSPLDSLAHKIDILSKRRYYLNFCCWYKREEAVLNLSKTGASLTELAFLRKKHSCLFKLMCQCCCRPDFIEKKRPVQINEQIKFNISSTLERMKLDRISRTGAVPEKVIPQNIMLQIDPTMSLTQVRPTTPNPSNIIASNELSRAHLKTNQLKNKVPCSTPSTQNINPNLQPNSTKTKNPTVPAITLDIIEMRLKIFQKEMLQLASLTDTNIHEIIHENFQNIINNIKPAEKEEPLFQFKKGKKNKTNNKKKKELVKIAVSDEFYLGKEYNRKRLIKIDMKSQQPVRKKKKCSEFNNKEYHSYCDQLGNFLKKLT